MYHAIRSMPPALLPVAAAAAETTTTTMMMTTKMIRWVNDFSTRIVDQSSWEWHAMDYGVI